MIFHMIHENYRYFVIHRVKSASVLRDNGCLEYRGGECVHRYGLVSITIDGKRRSVTAHRAMWMAEKNDFSLPRNIYIRHKCDNPCCVSMDHLEEGSAKDNARDCTERGRRASSYKKHARVLRFTDEEIRAIRNEPGTLKMVAWKFKTTTGYVCKIKRGKAKALVA